MSDCDPLAHAKMGANNGEATCTGCGLTLGTYTTTDGKTYTVKQFRDKQNAVLAAKK